MKALLSGVFIMLFIYTAYSQGWMSQGARTNALANNGVALTDVYSFHHNPGSLGFIEEGTLGLSYESRYALKELQTQSIAVAVPLKVGVISVGGQFYGYNTFKTLKSGLGYSLKLSDNLSAGVQLNYIGLRFGSSYYGSKDGISADFGALAKLNDKVNIGFSVVNLNRMKLADFQDERFATLLRMGLSYQLLESVLLLAEAEQEINYKARIRMGVEYNPIDFLYFRVGVQGNPLDMAFGFGFKLNRFKLDMATQYNSILGWSPTFSFSFSFYNPEK